MGLNTASVIPTAFSEEGVYGAMKQGATGIFYMTVPMASKVLCAPLAAAHGVFVAGTSIWGSLQKARSVGESHLGDAKATNELTSNQDWFNVAHSLSESTGLEFFEDRAQKYKADASELASKIKEQKHLENSVSLSYKKAELVKEHGDDFGQKLFDLIHEVSINALSAVKTAEALGEEAISASAQLLFKPGFDICLKTDASESLICANLADKQVKEVTFSGEEATVIAEL